MVMGLHFYSLLLTEKLLGWLKVAFKPHGIWKKERLDDKMFLTMNMIKVKSVHICLDYLDTFMVGEKKMSLKVNIMKTSMVAAWWSELGVALVTTY